MKGIPGFDEFRVIEPIVDEWPCLGRYYVEQMNGSRVLLKISDILQKDYREVEYKIIGQLEKLNVPIPVPIEFGVSKEDEMVYSMYTWLEYREMRRRFLDFTETQQYDLGLQSGKIIREKVQAFQFKEGKQTVEHFFSEAKRNIIAYRRSGVQFAGDEKLIKAVNDNMQKIYQDVDNRLNQPLSEWMHSLLWYAMGSSHYVTGLLRGFFDGDLSEAFFRFFTVYTIDSVLASLYQARLAGRDKADIAILKMQGERLAERLNDDSVIAPEWYLENFYIQYIDGLPYKLKVPFDMSFINKYGTVFKIFDDQDSGNICFGVEDKACKAKYFIKFAGAPTEQYQGTSEAAILRLRNAALIYQDLAHPSLVKFLKSEEVGGGFATIFEWVDGECPAGMYPASRAKFMKLSLSEKVKVYEDLVAFHVHIAKQNYIAIDFYDGSILYNFKNQKTMVCDIDLYAPMPYQNQTGRMWGSKRFLSPEEQQQGAVIDEVTNVYTMGILAFALFADYSKNFEEWPLNRALFDVVSKAISEEREHRQQSIAKLLSDWEEAKQ